MPLDKAPGPDGFIGSFYISCWHIIKGDFLGALDMFYRGDKRSLQAVNKKIVTLLPKLNGAIDIKDYRPVSLVHGSIICVLQGAFKSVSRRPAKSCGNAPKGLCEREIVT